MTINILVLYFPFIQSLRLTTETVVPSVLERPIIRNTRICRFYSQKVINVVSNMGPTTNRK